MEEEGETAGGQQQGQQEDRRRRGKQSKQLTYGNLSCKPVKWPAVPVYARLPATRMSYPGREPDSLSEPSLSRDLQPGTHCQLNLELLTALTLSSDDSRHTFLIGRF